MDESEARRLQAAFDRAQAALDAGRLDEAEAGYREVTEAVPDLQPAWFNLGLVYKLRREWPASLRCNARAAELDPEDTAAWWNLGTAATAVRDWGTARRAWRALGMAVPDGDGPIEMDLGETPVRLNPDGAGEVVWGARIDPVRARIASVPFPESGFRWRDVVLHDGEPRGERTVGGRTHHVFDALERWQASDVPTFPVLVEDATDDQVRDLIARFERAGWAAEDWTHSTRRLCRACSEGRPGEHAAHAHAHAHAADGDERPIGIAAPPERATEILDRWAAETTAADDARSRGAG
jgi:tetratricopeptide (TPR) repeat protein